MSNTRNMSSLCEYGSEHDWKPSSIQATEPGKWETQECSKCGKIRWIRRTLENNVFGPPNIS